MSSDTTGTRAPLRLLSVGGRPALRAAPATSSLAELVTDPADADRALVDVASLTPAAHAEACHYHLTSSPGRRALPFPQVVDRRPLFLGLAPGTTPVEPTELVTALPNHLIEQALHRPPRSLHSRISQAATAVTPQRATPAAVTASKGAPHE